MALQLQERNLATVLLVRSVEEHDPAFFAPDVVSAAALAASGARNDADLIEKRSAFLFLRLPASMRAWARIGLLPENALGIVALLSLLFGSAANFLGPAGQVHVLYNPLVFLIAWNMLAYGLFAWRAMRERRAAKGDADEARPTGHSTVLRLLVRDLWWAWNRWANRLSGAQPASAERIASSFRERYWQIAGPVVLARIDGLIHLGALFLVLGAIAGTYFRGLFLEYDAIWRSTFVTDPASVSGLLNFVLAPGMLIADGVFLAAGDVEGLLSPSGAPAAPWIHRIAITAAVLVAVPRLVLALLAARARAIEARRLRPDLAGEDYHLANIRAARDSRIHELRQEIAATIRTEIARLAESLAILVRDRFFDRSVAPALLQFRNRGGRIADLEADILAARDAFQPQLAEYLGNARLEFELALRTGLQKLVGRQLAQAAGLSGEVPQPGISVDGVSGSLATRLGDGVGAALIVAVTATVATLSGGVGQSLGIAVVSGLLGTSGPVGLVLGGLVALALSGIGYFMGRERVAEVVKSRHIPATLVAFALRESRIEEAREATYAHAKREVASHLEPRVTEVTEAVLAQLASAADPGAAPGSPPSS
jgi:hypothetical protein